MRDNTEHDEAESQTHFMTKHLKGAMLNTHQSSHPLLYHPSPTITPLSLSPRLHPALPRHTFLSALFICLLVSASQHLQPTNALLLVSGLGNVETVP
ncbi:hypothetical protein E2C01_090042 [Portunus trituberculatus]|uniref:Uncharacterized protein n=1 Tax=Portunus trituberculatus TaxID=210409 RepID=A0A5B7JKD2_PORTR|nr:hypothetical protein [Portunus trituberculatus]